jgi:aldose 1-epimerase
MTAVSSSIRELRVTTPSGADYVSLGMQTNYDDPLGKEWTGSETPSIDALLPGQAVEWKIRLEIFPISSHSGSH